MEGKVFGKRINQLARGKTNDGIIQDGAFQKLKKLIIFIMKYLSGFQESGLFLHS